MPCFIEIFIELSWLQSMTFGRYDCITLYRFNCLNIEAARFFINATDIIIDRHVPVLGDNCSQFYYWLALEDESMYPTFKAKELVLISTTSMPDPSDYVVALKQGAKKVIFRKWRLRGIDNDNNQEYSQLVSSNPDYPIIDSRHTSFEIYDVAIEHRSKLR